MSEEKMQCDKCSAKILPQTYKKNDGLCMPCIQTYTCNVTGCGKKILKTIYEKNYGYCNRCVEDKIFDSICKITDVEKLTLSNEEFDEIIKIAQDDGALLEGYSVEEYAGEENVRRTLDAMTKSQILHHELVLKKKWKPLFDPDPEVILTDKDRQEIVNILQSHGVELDGYSDEELAEEEYLEHVIMLLLDSKLICSVNTAEPPEFTKREEAHEFYTNTLHLIDSDLPNNRKIKKFNGTSNYLKSENCHEVTVSFEQQNEEYSWKFAVNDMEAMVKYYSELLQWAMIALDGNLFVCMGDWSFAVILPKAAVNELRKFRNECHWQSL